jgi:FHS family L-fucose permease-like MFS transporter
MSKPSIFTSPDGKSYFLTFALISSLFFLWALCNGMIDVMDKHFQELLHLNKRQSAWVQFAHYLGYFLMALPAGWLARKLGYKGGIIAGLLLVAIGCLWFIPATGIKEFWAFLLGICVISMGLTFLETVANPYTTVLGPQQYAAVRINIAQICNSVGWILGPIIGGMFFYSSKGAEAAQETLWIPYAWIAGAVLLLCLVFVKAKIPDIESEDVYHLDDSTANVSKSIWSHGHFSGAVLAQFLYVACQAGIFGFFIFYIVEDVPAIAESMKTSWLLGGESGSVVRGGQRFISEQGATKLLAYIGFTLFLLGRFTGAGILNKISAHKVLSTYAAVNAVLMVIIVLKLGWISLIALFLSFFFMSIMFPTIFALGIHGLGKKAKVASSFIVMAIMGGALMPKLMGWIADNHGMSVGFIVPAVCFLVVALYGGLWSKLSGTKSMLGVDASKGH